MKLPSTALLIPQWPAPGQIIALTTTRFGGVSEQAYADFNLAAQVGDDPLAVAENRSRLQAHLGKDVALHWLQQVHGTRVIHAQRLASGDNVADAVYSDARAQACAVLTADCLPVLFCSADGEEVAAAHAGWRGLAAGVLSATVKKFQADPGQLLAWLGPAIGPQAFEVGAEVREAFLQRLQGMCPQSLIEQAFVAVNSKRTGKYFADLYQLARLELQALGVTQVYGGGWCTFNEERFYSYRRNKTTGRMASVIVRTQ